MSVDKVMMAAVAGLGLFAVYKLTTASKDNQGGDAFALLGDPLSFQNGQTYRGRLTLPGASDPSNPMTDSATESMLIQALQVLGFADVHVFMNVRDLPPGWPTSTQMNVAPSTRWFEARWNGPSMTLPRPPYLEQVWSTSPKGPVVSGTRGMQG